MKRRIFIFIFLLMIAAFPARADYFFGPGSTGTGSMTYPGIGIPYTADGASWGASFGVGTMTDGKICTYATAGTLLSCNTNPATFQAASAVLTTYAGINPSANMQTWLGSANYAAMFNLPAVAFYGASFNTAKVAGTAGKSCVPQANLTDLYGWCEVGPASKTSQYDLNFIKPSTEPAAGDVLINSVPDGNHNVTQTFGPMGKGMVEEIVANFNGTGTGGIIAANQIVYIQRDYAISSINAWDVTCNAEDAAAITFDVFGLAYAGGTALPTVTLCGSGTKPSSGGATKYVNQAAWNCSTTSSVANFKYAVTVLTSSSTTSTWCAVTLKVTR